MKILPLLEIPADRLRIRFRSAMKYNPRVMQMSIACRRSHSLLSVLRGGNPEILRSAWMNGLLFVPLGMLLPELFPREWPLSRRLLVTGLASLVFSTGIELMQWCWTLGTAETDDVLANTLGAVIGVLSTHLGCAYLSQCERFR